MIIIPLDAKTTIEGALKKYKAKYSKLKISKELNERKQFKKDSEKKREVRQKAKYIQRLKDKEQ